MSEWAVVGVIVTLVGLFGALLSFVNKLTAPVNQLNVTVAELNANVTAMNGELKSLTSRNSDTHDRIFKELGKHDGSINDHETRISVAENDIKTVIGRISEIREG